MKKAEKAKKEVKAVKVVPPPEVVSERDAKDPGAEPPSRSGSVWLWAVIALSVAGIAVMTLAAPKIAAELAPVVVAKPEPKPRPKGKI